MSKQVHFIYLRATCQVALAVLALSLLLALIFNTNDPEPALPLIIAMLVSLAAAVVSGIAWIVYGPWYRIER